jgi:hypothetical protein
MHCFREPQCGSLSIGESGTVDVTDLAALDEFLFDDLATRPVAESAVESIVTAVELSDPQSHDLLRSELHASAEQQRPVERRPRGEQARGVSHCTNPPGIDAAFNEGLQLLGHRCGWEQRDRNGTGGLGCCRH